MYDYIYLYSSDINHNLIPIIITKSGCVHAHGVNSYNTVLHKNEYYLFSGASYVFLLSQERELLFTIKVNKFVGESHP